MLFPPGSILVVTEKPQITCVTVKRNLGCIKGLGWLLFTEEGNHILVRGQEKGYMEKITFITDPEYCTKLLREAR